MVTAQPLDIDLITKNEGDALQMLIENLLKEFGGQVQQIILFGSKARGDSTPDSDIDILILMDEENWQRRTMISKMAARIELQYDVLFNTLLIASKRWRQMSLERFTLCRNVEREGVLLFNRA